MFVLFDDALTVLEAVQLPVATVRSLLIRDGRTVTVARLLSAPGRLDPADRLLAERLDECPDRGLELVLHVRWPLAGHDLPPLGWAV